jgi:hypothetical protein
VHIIPAFEQRDPTEYDMFLVLSDGHIDRVGEMVGMAIPLHDLPCVEE